MSPHMRAHAAVPAAWSRKRLEPDWKSKGNANCSDGVVRTGIANLLVASRFG